MTEVFARPVGRDGGTFALIAGIGAYARRVPDNRGPHYGSLPAATRSGVKIADFVIENRDRFSRPLCGVELLLSDPRNAGGAAHYRPPGQSAALPVELPTIANLAGAVDRWLAQCDAPQHRAIVYCVGHGIWDEQPFLLSEDFGSNRRMPFDGMVAIRDFLVGTKGYKIGGLLAMFDCCKSLDDTLLKQLGGPRGDPLITVGADGLFQYPRALLTSAAIGEYAVARASGRTHFCDVFIEAMSGDAAEMTQSFDTWEVTCDSLQIAMQRIARRRRLADWAVTPAHEWKSFSFFKPDTPDIEVEFGTDPTAAVYDANLSVEHQREGPQHSRNKPSSKVRWRLKAQSGYCARAEFEDGGRWKSACENFSVMPRTPPVRIFVKARTP